MVWRFAFDCQGLKGPNSIAQGASPGTWLGPFQAPSAAPDPKGSNGKKRLALYGAVTGAFVALHAVLRAGADWWWLAGALMLLVTAFLARLEEPLPWIAVFVVGLLCRLILFPLPPFLSADVYRYLWDGFLQANGINPFLHAPDATALAAFHDRELYERVASAPYHSVYPPVSQFLFHLCVRLIPSAAEAPWTAAYVLKGLIGVVELAGLWILCRYGGHRFLPVLYAWNPLVVVETWGQAHTEGLALGLLAAAFRAWRTGRFTSTITFVTIAGWVKLFPLLFLPLLVFPPPFSRRRLFTGISISGALTILLWIPFVGNGSALLHYHRALDAYVSSFEFNAMPYYVLKGFFGTAAGLLLLWMWLAFVLVCWVETARGRLAAEQAAVWIVATAVLTATTLHPWYFLLSLFVMALVGQRPPAHWLWLSASSFFTYLYYPYPGTYTVTVTGIWMGWLGIFLFELRRWPRRALGQR